jgi:circadian clock protein KaiC
MGGTGTGKTLMGLHFVAEGARKGEPSILFTLEETVEQLRAIGDAFGFDLTGLEKRGLVQLRYAAPVELSTDRFLNEARELTDSVGAKRAVLDSLTSLSLGAVTDRRYKELVYSLAKHFRSQGITLFMTMEISELLGAAQLSGHGVSFAADNVIQLRYVEMEGRLDRAISVIKARGVNLNTELRPFQIGASGMQIGEASQFKGLRGVLTGLPSHTEPATR